MTNTMKFMGALALAITLSACSGMNQTQKNTAVGAAIGGVAGNVIGNSTGATLGRAAVDRLIGSQVK